MPVSEGCTAYWLYDAKRQTKADLLKYNRFSWTGGGCEKGKLINGQGTLKVANNFGGGEVTVTTFTGRLVDGVFDGSVRFVPAPPFTGANDYQYKMGCTPWLHDPGQCTPRPRLATSSASSGGTAVPPLRPTITQEAHNPAGEASDCVRVIYSDDFEVEHVSTTQKAVFRNSCSRPVEVSWCTLTGDCRPGYTNIATVPARKDRGFSYEPSVAGSKVAYAACYNGFVRHQGELSKKLLHACK